MGYVTPQLYVSVIACEKFFLLDSLKIMGTTKFSTVKDALLQLQPKFGEMACQLFFFWLLHPICISPGPHIYERDRKHTNTKVEIFLGKAAKKSYHIILVIDWTSTTDQLFYYLHLALGSRTL